jgi:hypothetical protein
MNDREKNRRENDSRQSGNEAPNRDTGRDLNVPPPAAGAKLDEDLQRNPGIGQSKGSFATGIPPSEIESDNTVEGDVDNDTTATDGVPERQRERTNS